MQNEISPKAIIETVTKTGNIFLAEYKNKPIPENYKDLLFQMKEIESTCLMVLKSSIDKLYPGIPWVDDDEFDSDAQKKPADFEEYWVCDTMDGAVQYVQHLPGWTINLVLIRNGSPYFSVICDPTSKEVFWAKKGEGAFLNDTPILPSKKIDPLFMVAVFEYGHQEKVNVSMNEHLGKTITNLLDTFGVIRNYGPHGLQIAYVASGRIDLFIQKDLDTHNWLAGILIASEAGLDILSADGKPWFWGCPGILIGTKTATDIYIKTIH